MLKKYILALFLFFVVVIGSQYVNFNTSYNVGSVRQVYNSNLEKSKFAVKEIMEENDKIKMRALEEKILEKVGVPRREE